MIGPYLIPLLAFIPGSALLYFISSKYSFKLSTLEVMVLGSVIWNYLFVSIGYVVGIFSNLMKEFFIIFTLSSILLLIYSCYCLLVENKNSVMKLKINFDQIILLLSLIPLLVILFASTLSHSIFREYDAIFKYLPLAKSILETGGLQYDFYKQSSLAAASPPAIPIMFAWLRYLCPNTVNFDLGVRIFPLTYMLLTALTVYLITSEFSKDSNIGIIASHSFLSMPVVLAIASNYSLYLDIPFTFLLFLGMFVLLRIYERYNNEHFWLFMLGLIISLLLLVKDTSYFLFPSLIVLILLPLKQQLGKTSLIVFVIASSLLFTGAYNILFIIDIRALVLGNFPADLLSGFIIRQIPILVIFTIYSILSFKLSKLDSSLYKMRCIVFFLISFIPVFLYILRNILLLGTITNAFPLFNENWKVAIRLKGQALGNPKLLPSSISSILRWDILFTSVSLGAIFLIPSLMGLFVILHDFFKKQADKKSFIIITFFLMLFSLWSWTFYCSYKGPELRRLLYFAPLFAIFIAKGVQSFDGFIGYGKSLPSRFVIFNSASLIYLWLFKLKLGSLDIKQVIRLESLGIADLDMLIAFAFFFILSFYPPIHGLKGTMKNYVGMISRYTRFSIPFTLIMGLFISIVPISLYGLYNIKSNIYYTPESWENDLSEVISYVNKKLQDNYSIVTCYALPISYFTEHPVIEVVSSNGIMNLLSFPLGDVEAIRNSLIEHNIRYLLYPKPSHSYFKYFEKLRSTIPVLSSNITSKTPYVVHLKSFSKFELFKVITQDEAMSLYRYLTFFEDNWIPLNNHSILTSLNLKTMQYASIFTTEYVTRTIADDNQTFFWTGYKSNPSDEILLFNNVETKVSGDDSLGIGINGTGNLVIGHRYELPQDWSSFKDLTFYFYSLNTSKPILITLHTKPWNDYYHIRIKDDYLGWKLFSLPLNSFQTSGEPSLSDISSAEILLGNRTATYYLDGIRLEGYKIGLKGQIPPITTESSKVKIVLSIKKFSIQFPVMFTLTSTYGDLTQPLTEEINLITIPSEILENGAVLTLYYFQSSINEKLELSYLGILDS